MSTQLTSKIDLESINCPKLIDESTFVLNQQEQEDFNEQEWFNEWLKESPFEQLTFH